MSDKLRQWLDAQDEHARVGNYHRVDTEALTRLVRAHLSGSHEHRQAEIAAVLKRIEDARI